MANNKRAPHSRAPGKRSPQPFPRRLPKIPTQMQRSAELWLDLFSGFCGQLIEDETSSERQILMLDRAGLLANRALELFEERWPGVRL